MNIIERFAQSLSKVIPESRMAQLEQTMRYAGMTGDTKQWLGFTLTLAWLYSMIVVLVLVLVFGVVSPFLLIPAGVLALIAVFFVAYYLVTLRVEDRRKRVEAVLPDALMMIAANIRAGTTPIVALRMAARPELWPLDEEIRIATAKSLGSESFTEALISMNTRIKSEILERTLSLFTSAIKGGGTITQMLENTANEILEAQDLRRELIANTNMYVVFILFTILIGMPMLLSISIQFVTMIEDLQRQVPTGGVAAEIGLAIKAPVSADFVTQIALAALILTSIFATMLIGVIHDGNEVFGLRYAAPFTLATLVVFYIISTYVLKALLTI